MTQAFNFKWIHLSQKNKLYPLFSRVAIEFDYRFKAWSHNNINGYPQYIIKCLHSTTYLDKSTTWRACNVTSHDSIRCLWFLAIHIKFFSKTMRFVFTNFCRSNKHLNTIRYVMIMKWFVTICMWCLMATLTWHS